MQQRNSAFDIMKGIAVLFMIWEHCNLHMLPFYCIQVLASTSFHDVKKRPFVN